MTVTLYTIFSIAVILFLTKIFGLTMRKWGLPSVLGCIIAGFLLGPALWEGVIPENGIFPLDGGVIKTFAEIGVLLVLFSAGLETNLGELKKMGVKATLIALGGVLVPLILGTVVGFIFIYPTTKNVFTAIFLGVIMCATSVGITVETLKELGKLKTEVGTIIVSAAIIDDVIGIIILTVFMSVAGSGDGISSPILSLINPSGNAVISVLWMLVYFVLAVVGGIGISKLFNHVVKKHPDTHRLPIYSLVVCFIYSVVAEVVFGVADITGAYIAGVVLSTNHRAAEYVDRKVAVPSYMLFGPIFFAHIGMQISFTGFTLDVIWLMLAFVIVAIASKIIGCSVTSKMLGYDNKDSLRIGIGMIARGEVALVVAQKGISAGLMDGSQLTIVVMLVLVSSVLAPILLKWLYKEKTENKKVA
ncbi:MAG: cation:proton antiporter [Clostridia bacterium]|nr:cation:proton antiporter [Clostridia bacterium]